MGFLAAFFKNFQLTNSIAAGGGDCDEEWREVVGWPYQISSHGRLRRTESYRQYQAGMVLKPREKFQAGRPKVGNPLYLEYILNHKGKTKSVSAHRLVCEAFHGPRPSERHEVAHWDGNTRNSHYTNLRWATPKENSGNDRKRHGRTACGDRNAGAKLTTDDVIRIKKLLMNGRTNREIAETFNVSKSAIERIKSRRNWSHLPENRSAGLL